MFQSMPAPRTNTENGPADPSQERRDAELRRLRKALADAWWNEEPLDRIESIERQINACLASTSQRC